MNLKWPLLGNQWPVRSRTSEPPIGSHPPAQCDTYPQCHWMFGTAARPTLANVSGAKNENKRLRSAPGFQWYFMILFGVSLHLLELSGICLYVF